MKVYPVKHSALLRSIPRKQTKNDIGDLIQKLVHNLVHITDPTGEFLLHLDDGRVIDTKSWAGWEWTHGIGLYGMYKYYQQTSDKKTVALIDQWFIDRFSEELPTKNVNTMCPFLTLAYRYEETGEQSWLPYLETWADWAMKEMARTENGGMQHLTYAEENHQQLWDDTLMMTVLPLAKIGLLLNKPHYVEEAKYQFLIHIQYLMDKETGVWFHGWTFDGTHNFANARWARGNSWLTIVIPELLELLDLPENDPFYRQLVHVLNRQIKALKEYQHSSGLWHTLLDDPTSYTETSASAGFAYGILKSVRKGYIDRDYAEVAEKAIQALIPAVNHDGELTGVSFGTGMGHDLDFYRNIPITSMPYGQAMAILCFSEYMRSYL